MHFVKKKNYAGEINADNYLVIHYAVSEIKSCWIIKLFWISIGHGV